MTNSKGTLPAGYRARPAAMGDVSEAVSLINTASQHFIGVDEITVERLKNDWRTPGFEPQKNGQMVFSPEGKLIGAIEVWDVTRPPVHPFSWMAVDPQHRGAGPVREYLLDWGEARARQVLDEVDPELRVSMRFWNYHENTFAPPLLEARGFTLIRHSFQMRYKMDSQPPEPEFPEGITVRRYVPDQDAEAVYRVDDEVFKDHFGYIEEPFEKGFERFMHHMTGHEGYDPDLWFLAEEGEEIVGICLCRKWNNEDREAGYISSLGVRRPWRRQGIALALLHQAFNVFYDRGKKKVDLGVDAENLTGALRLYRQAGMTVHRQYDMYEKELRSGKEISVTGIDLS